MRNLSLFSLALLHNIIKQRLLAHIAYVTLG